MIFAMDTLTCELNKARQLPLVNRAFVTEDYGKVVIELRRDPAIGGLHKNVLYFLSTEFVASEVEQTISQIVKVAKNSST
jgi:hypothetical protein